MTLVSTNSFDLSIEQAELVKKTIDYEKAFLSSNTLRSYKSMCKKFQKWCEVNNQAFLPTTAETLAFYLSSLGARVSFSTLDSTIAAIEIAHEKAGVSIQSDKNLYKRVRKGIRRTHKEKQAIKQAPIMTVLKLKAVCSKLKDTLKDLRDRTLLIMTFFGSVRRSEVVSLDKEHLEFNEKGVAASLMRSKTSDTKQTTYISYARDKDICPVKALKEWMEKSQIQPGSIFRALKKGKKTADRLSGHAVSEIIKRHFGREYSVKYKITVSYLLRPR